MAHYLLQVAYTSEAWVNMLKNPQDRIEIVAKAVQNLGGSVVGGWLSFGEYDVVAILRLPDDATAAAFAMLVAAGGACKSVETTPLLSSEEAIEAAKKAAKAEYAPLRRVGKKEVDGGPVGGEVAK
jgi:uncharacterized protein with GYD domain